MSLYIGSLVFCGRGMFSAGGSVVLVISVMVVVVAGVVIIQSLRAFRRTDLVSLCIGSLVFCDCGFLVFWPISWARRMPESLQSDRSQVLLWS